MLHHWCPGCGRRVDLTERRCRRCDRQVLWLLLGLAVLTIAGCLAVGGTP